MSRGITASLPMVPDRAQELLLWSSLVFLWTAANYLHRFDPLGREEHRSRSVSSVRRWRWGVPARSLVGAGVAVWLAGSGLAGLSLAVLFLAFAVLLPLVRMRWARGPEGQSHRELRAEWELVCNAAFLAASALIVGAWDLVPRSFVSRSVEAGRLSVLLVGVSSLVFLIRGGTHVVRGVLEKSDTVPVRASAGGAGTVRHGVTIGNLERFLLFLFSLLAQYGALGLVLAAKGLVRAVEWRDRQMVEYFLIGTLASAGLAVVVGFAVRALAAAWW